MLPATDSTAFLIGQTIGFLFVFFLLVIFPMLAILRMARHVGISGSDRVLWVVVIYCMPLFGPVTYFIWELTKGRKLRRTVPEAVRPNSGTPVAPERKAVPVSEPAGRARAFRDRLPPAEPAPAASQEPTRKGKDRPGTACRHAVSRHRTRIRRRMKRQGRSRCRKRPFADQRRMISLDPIRFPSV